MNTFEPKQWEDFLKERLQLQEDDEANNTTDGVANSDAPMFTMSRFAGVDCVHVDDDTYHKAKFGKKPFSRWSGVIEDEGLRDFVKKQFNTKSRLMIQNSKTGAITYIKR